MSCFHTPHHDRVMQLPDSPTPQLPNSPQTRTLTPMAIKELPPLPPAANQAKLPSIPHVVASFEGEYFKGVVGAMEVVPFSEDVLVPHTWLAKTK